MWLAQLIFRSSWLHYILAALNSVFFFRHDGELDIFHYGIPFLYQSFILATNVHSNDSR